MSHHDLPAKFGDLIEALLRAGYTVAAKVVSEVKEFVEAPGAPDVPEDMDVRDKMGK